MLEFANKSYLYLIALLPLSYFVIRWWSYRKKKDWEKVLDAKMLQRLTSSSSPTKKLWKLRLQHLSVLFLLLAFARPQVGMGEKEVKTTGIELIFAVDVSRSMLAEDVKPSRLAQTKRDLSRLLDRLGGDKVGLIVFAGSGVLVSPLTSDYSALKMFIDGLSPESVSSQGTKFSDAIEIAASSFKRGGVESSEEIYVSKVLLIASDGEDNEEGAIELAKKNYKEGMRIFTLGFGTEKGGSIPIRDEFGNLKGYRKDNSGNIILTKTKTQLLSQISESAGGKFYHATVGGNHIESLFQDFNGLDKAEFASKLAKDYNEYYQWPLALAILFALLDLLLSERAKKSMVWRGRFEGV